MGKRLATAFGRRASSGFDSHHSDLMEEYMSSRVIKAPTAWGIQNIEEVPVFLAGSIEMGSAEDWQSKIADMLLEAQDYSFIVLNPRRDDWDNSWEQEYKNKQFHEQVAWELDAQERSKYILMHFDPTTKSPITLLELGLFGRTKKIFVSCPRKFYRRGNVEIVCRKYGINIYNSLEEMAMGFGKHLVLE